MAVTPATLEQNKQVVEGFFQTINTSANVDDLALYMASDVIDYNKIIVGEADEPGAAFEGMRQQKAAFNPIHMQLEELIAENDRVVARITMSLVHSGSHPRMLEPTHRSAVVESIYVFTLRENKISELRAVSDRLGLFLQLGWAWPEAD